MTKSSQAIYSFLYTFFLIASSWLAEPTLAANTFSLASLGDAENLAQGLYSGDHAAVTPDGRYVVFRSGETQFVSPNTSGNQIFLRDRVSGTTELISQSNSGTYGNGSSDWPAISNDGCLVVFESAASNLVTNDNNGTNDVFLRNRCSGPNTTLLSINSMGTQAAGESKNADISGDGSHVVFWSYATNLLDGVTNSGQIYRRNLNTGVIDLISASVIQNGQGGNFSSSCPAISNDGSKVAFWSYADDLVAGDANGLWDIFVWDSTDTPAIRRASQNSQGIPQNQGGNGISSITCPAISGDGLVVAFASHSTNLVDDDTNGKSDIFIKDLQTGTLQRASVDSTGTQQANADAYGRPALSLDGTWVAFTSTATNLATETGNSSGTPRTIVHNRNTGQTFALTSASNTGDSPAISDDLDGRYIVAFANTHLDPQYASAGIFVYDRGPSGGSNLKPNANAGEDQTVNIGATVTLNGSNSSDPEGGSLTYTWSQLFGPEAVTLTHPTSATPSFTPNQTGTYIFQLTVSDGVNTSEPSFVSIAVDNHKPVADAGTDQIVVTGALVSLNGSTSQDSDGDELSYTWTQLFGPEAVSFDDASSATPSFNAGQSGTYIFQLTVSDGIASSDPSFVSINVSDPAQNNPINVDAGQTRKSNIGDLQTLNGNLSKSSTVNSKKLRYTWTQKLGPQVKLTGSTKKMKRTFTPTKPGTYVFSVVASDGVYTSNESLVVVSVTPSITVSEPSATTWSIGQTVNVQWSTTGIAANKKLAIVLRSNAESSSTAIKTGIRAGAGSYSFKIKPKLKSSQERTIGVCLLSSAKNDQVCGFSNSAITVE